MSEFKEKVIGLPDTKKEQAIIKIYSEICENATRLLWVMESYLESMDKLDLQEFFNFLNEKDPKVWLYQKYIEFHGLTFPGIAISKIIEFEMVDVPVEHFEELLKSRIELLEQIQKTKEFNFFYPLKAI